jgi:hypothetical protein
MLTAMVMCREYLVYLDGFPPSVELRGLHVLIASLFPCDDCTPRTSLDANNFEQDLLDAVDIQVTQITSSQPSPVADRRPSWVSEAIVTVTPNKDQVQSRAASAEGPQSHSSSVVISSNGSGSKRVSFRTDDDIYRLDSAPLAPVHLHALALTSADSLQFLREAMEDGLPVSSSSSSSSNSTNGARQEQFDSEGGSFSCSVTCCHLAFDSSSITTGDTRFKVWIKPIVSIYPS